MATKKLPRGLRNNNPGNIRINSDKFQGEILPSSDSEFKQFETMAYGYRAIYCILRTYHSKYALKTITQMINRWAPTNENHTDVYIRTVSSRSGIPADKEVNIHNEEQMTAIVAAMSYQENGIEADRIDVLQGWKMI